MEIAQESLQHIIETRKKTNSFFTEKEIEDIINDLLKGFIFLLDKKFHHQDVKPANILLNLENKWVLTDFGLAV